MVEEELIDIVVPRVKKKLMVDEQKQTSCRNV
jgi:hypothetical protein